MRPRQARYQAALRPDMVSILIIQISRTGMLANRRTPRGILQDYGLQDYDRSLPALKCCKVRSACRGAGEMNAALNLNPRGVA